MTYRGAPNVEPDYRQLVMGEYKPMTSGQTLSRMKIVAGPDKADGRGLTIASPPGGSLTDITVNDCMIQSNGDDGICLWGNVQRIRLNRSWGIGRYQWPDPLDYTRTLKCFIAGADPDQPDPNYPDWFKACDCSFMGGFRCPKITGGVFRFERCYFGPSRRNVLTRATGDFVNCDFVVQVGMKTGPGDNNWSDSASVFVRPLCLEQPKPNSLYFKGCTLTVLDATGAVIRTGPADGPALCRMLVDGPVGSDVDVAANVFRSKANRK